MKLRQFPPVAGILTLVWCQAALAQSEGTITPPAEKSLVTSGGVDMRTGQYAYASTDLSVQDESARINLVRSGMIGVPRHANPFGNFTHNFDIMITEFRVDMSKSEYQHGYGQDYRMGVRFGGKTQAFDKEYTNSGFVPVSKGEKGVLTYSGDPASAAVVYTYRAPGGEVAVFRQMGGGDCATVIRCAFVSSISYPDGTLLSFEYETRTGTEDRARLRAVTSNHGYALLFEYSGGGGGTWSTVTKACILNLTVIEKPGNNTCPTGVPTTLYTYASGATMPVMTSATNPLGKAAQFGYSWQSGVPSQMRFYHPEEANPWLTNDLFGGSTDDGGYILQVGQQTFADGRAISYNWDDPSILAGSSIQSRFGGSYIENGKTVVAEYGYHLYPPSLTISYLPRQSPEMFGNRHHQFTSGPQRIVDELGRTTTFDYCDPAYEPFLPAWETNRCVVGELRSWTDPEGNVTHVSYDSAGNLVGTRRVAKPGLSQPDIITSATYACGNPKTCSKPATMTDAKGNVTSWTYDATHGGVLTQTMPAVDGVQAKKRYAYAQHYAWVKAGSGYAQTANPIWLLSEERTCLTSATVGNACAAGASDEVVTVYQYQAGSASVPSNLLLKEVAVTSNGTTLRTCYSHDAWGRRISETEPRAGLAVCP